MSFTLSAAGHIPLTNPADGSAQDQAAAELALYEEVRAVLAKPQYGVVTSSFGGSHISGSLHEADTGS